MSRMVALKQLKFDRNPHPEPVEGRGFRLHAPVTALDFTFVTPQLAVGGGFAEAAAERLAREHHISAIVDLRDEARDDEVLLLRHGVTLLHLPTLDHQAVSQSMLDEGVAFVAERMERDERVLVHCQHGIGRSVLLALCVLIARGEAPLDALRRIKDARAVASPSPAQYEAWQEWMQRHGIEPPGFDAFAAIAYRHLRPG